MVVGGLQGEQYVRLAPGAAEALAPYVGVPPGAIPELVLDLEIWPDEIRPVPAIGWDGRLIAGDPVLIDVQDRGLLLQGRPPVSRVLVPWSHVRAMHVVGHLTAADTSYGDVLPGPGRELREPRACPH